MKNGLTFVALFVSMLSIAQKTEFGLSIDGGIAVSGKEKTLSLIAEIQPNLANGHLIIPNSVWNNKQIMFDVYPKWVDGLWLSVGLRMFTVGWEIDTIVGGYHVGSSWSGYWKTIYARRESKIGYMTPTVGLGYQHKLSDAFSVKLSASFGLFGILRMKKQHSYAYDPKDEDYFAYGDSGLRDGYYYFDTRFDIFNLQINTQFVYGIKGLSIYAGPAYFYQKGNFLNYSGLHLNGGISYRFHRKAD